MIFWVSAYAIHEEVFFLSLGLLSVICGVVTMIVIVVMKPDFDYSIKPYNEYIIFEMSETDHRIIHKSFSIANKTRKQILLDDGTSRIEIAYNQEVLQFLDEIKK